ncbi:MAG TPA: DMT family transporter [Gaiellaceae bacterium]|jgi:drug/metabolite transporter (DMT)-like permease
MQERRKGRLYVTLAAIAWSTAGLMQRELSVGVATQLAGRALFAVVGLLIYVAVAQRGHLIRAFGAIGGAGLGIAGLMALSSGAFLIALNHTSVANVLFMQALSPIIAAALGHLLGEPVSKRTWIAMAIAVAGVTIMIGGPGRPNGIGLALSLVMSFSFAGTIVLTRHRRDVSMAPATCLSQVIVFLIAAPFASTGGIGPKDALLLVLLGIGQIGLGLIFLTIGGRLIPAAEVGLITLLEIVLGPLWVWIFLSEHPGIATVIGGVIVLAAVLFQTTREAEPAPAPI